jgi:hypothetical protein
MNRRAFRPSCNGIEVLESRKLLSNSIAGSIPQAPTFPSSLVIPTNPWNPLLHGYQHTPKVPLSAPPTIPFCPQPPFVPPATSIPLH